MSYLDKLERKLPWLNFPNLNLYMVVIFLVSLAIDMINPYFYYIYLSLDVSKILHGEVYRLLTFIFYPIASSYMILLSLLMIYVYYSITKTLVMMWGNFKFNLYLFIGYISQILAAFIIYFILKRPIVFYPSYTFFSLIMAFALSFPDAYFMIYFLIPIKAKFFAYVEIVFYFIAFLSEGIEGRVAIACSAINVLVFFVLWKNKI